MRLALTLSSLTTIPVLITSIRGNRSGDGGLKGSHLAAVKFLARACGARTTGMELKSKDLLFEPCRDEAEMSGPGMERCWKTLKDEDGKIVGRAAEIKMPTPGSIFLIFQALLPYLLFACTNPPNENKDNAEYNISTTLPVTLTIQGGTNVSSSPSFEYVQQVLLPYLHRIGIPPIALTLNKRGWTQGCTAIGSVTFTITPFAPGARLPAFSLPQRDLSDKVNFIHVSLLAATTDARSYIRTALAAALPAQFGSDITITCPVDEDSHHPKRLYLLLVAETSTGCRYGRDWLYDRKRVDMYTDGQHLVTKVVADLAGEVRARGPVDEFMEDQLVVFCALARGKSSVGGSSSMTQSMAARPLPSENVAFYRKDSGIEKGKSRDEDQGRESRSTVRREPTLHTRTAQWVAEKMLNVRFEDKEGCCECDGIGFTVGASGGGGGGGGDASDVGEDRGTLIREMERLEL